MSKRIDKAMEVLAAGGYFRKQLENVYGGREQFVMRLRDASGCVVRGVGFAVYLELSKAGKLQYRRPSDSRSSVWPEEFVLREEAPAQLAA